MAETPSTMLPLGTSAPNFNLPDPSTGKSVSLADFKDAPALLVAFICNHCPYVKHIQKQFAALAKEYQARGVGGRRHQLQRCRELPGRQPREDGGREQAGGLYASPISTTKRSKWQKPIAPLARPTFISSIAATASSIADSSTTAVPATDVPSPAPTCVRRWKRCWPAARFPPTRSPAWAATSSGNAETLPTPSRTGGIAGNPFPGLRAVFVMV